MLRKNLLHGTSRLFSRQPHIADLELHGLKVAEDPGGRRLDAADGAGIGQHGLAAGQVADGTDIGNMVMAGDGALIQSGDTWVWRFPAYLTSLTHEPYGPVGHVDVDANTGAILSDQQTVEAMYERGQQYIPAT